MTDGQLQAVFERAKRWPKELRRSAAQILVAIERQEKGALQGGQARLRSSVVRKSSKKLSSSQVRKHLRQQWDALAGEKDAAKKIIDFNRNLHVPGVPVVRLVGKAARDLDKLVEEGVQEYLDGKTSTIKSLADLE